MFDASTLRFSELRLANVSRCEDVFHKLNEWSPTDWACAAAGEMGEVCNFIKKMRRGDNVSIEDIESELADVVIYIDLLAARLGISLGNAVVRKFNEVSVQRNSNVILDICDN